MPVPHGHYSRYTNYKCRCLLCRAAWTNYCRERRQQRERDLATGRITREHGVYTTYANYGCRCAPCRYAAARQRQLWPSYRADHPSWTEGR